MSISVIVPVFNIEKYLAKCIDSILAQTFRDFEIILVDDGSTDKSPLICDRYMAENPGIIKVLHTQNAGQGSARNAGAALAKCEYLQFVDGDDFIEPDMMEKMMDAAKSNGFPDMVVCGIRIIDENGKTTSVIKENLPPMQRLTAADNKDALIIHPSPCNRIIRRRFYIDSGLSFPAGVWYEDVRVTVKLSALAESVVYVDRPFYNYYTRIGSSTKNTDCQRMRELKWAFEDILLFFKNNGLYESFREQLEFLTTRHLYIAGSVRVIRIENSNPLLTEFRLFMYDNFPDFRKNSYLPRLGRNKRIIFGLLNLKMYRIIYLIFKIRQAIGVCPST